MRRALVLLSLCWLGCGSDELPPPRSAPSPSSTAPATAEAPPGAFWREDVDRVVDAGLGRFLGFLFTRLKVEPQFDERQQFQGWEVVAMRDAGFWEGVDLRPGDVVTAVNDRPLERDVQAHEAFVALKEQSEIVISLLRGGERMELVFKIVPRSVRPAGKPAVRPAAKPAARPAPRAPQIPSAAPAGS